MTHDCLYNRSVSFIAHNNWLSIDNKHFSLFSLSTWLWWSASTQMKTSWIEFCSHNMSTLAVWKPTVSELKKRRTLKSKHRFGEIDSHHAGGARRLNLIKHLLRLQENSPNLPIGIHHVLFHPLQQVSAHHPPTNASTLNIGLSSSAVGGTFIVPVWPIHLLPQS